MRKRKRTRSDVTGLKQALTIFITNQTHVKAVDNLRRLTGATKNQLS